MIRGTVEAGSAKRPAASRERLYWRRASDWTSAAKLKAKSSRTPSSAPCRIARFDTADATPCLRCVNQDARTTGPPGQERRTHDDEFEGQCRRPFPHHGTDPHGFR